MTIRQDPPYAYGLNDLFDDNFIESLCLKTYMLDVKYSRGIIPKRRFARKIFMEFMKMVVLDCIHNGSYFVSPNQEGFFLKIMEKSHTEVQSILQKRNAYPGVDLKKTKGKIYQFTMVIPSAIPEYKYKTIRINKTLYDQLVETANNGANFCYRQTKMSDYIGDMKKMFPRVPEEKLRNIVKLGTARVTRHAKANKHIVFKNQTMKFVVFPNSKI